MLLSCILLLGACFVALQIDIEFLNGNPTKPNTVWLNTYKQ